MLALLKERIRSAIWSRLAPPPPPVLEPTYDPLGIDWLSKLPVYYDPPECPICVFDESQCHDCGGTALDPEAPYGAGLESTTFTHLHDHVILGSRGTNRIPARRNLCLKCFRLDWAKAHPDKPCDL